MALHHSSEKTGIVTEPNQAVDGAKGVNKEEVAVPSKYCRQKVS